MAQSNGQPTDQSPFHLDLETEQVGVVYGKALFAATENADCSSEIQSEFAQLFTEVFDRYPAFSEILVSSMVSADDKEAILDRVLTGRVSAMTLNFLKVLAKHERLDALAMIVREFSSLIREKLGEVDVRITTASPMDDAAAEALGEKLKTLIGGEPEMTLEVDPELIGGIFVRVDDTVFDGSLANQLEQIREQMINRSAHEIQSRRDRFRHSAGN